MAPGHRAAGAPERGWARADVLDVAGGFDCAPRRGESACWTRVREKHGIPAAVQREQVISADPTAAADPERSAQITLHVSVQRFARRSMTYLHDPPGCAAAP
jgi:hypothetical protein